MLFCSKKYFFAVNIFNTFLIWKLNYRITSFLQKVMVSIGISEIIDIYLSFDKEFQENLCTIYFF